MRVGAVPTPPPSLVPLAPVVVEGRAIEVSEIAGDPRVPTVVMLHEGLGSISQWRDTPGRIAVATGGRVVVYARWDHGRSDRAPTPRTREFFATEADVVLPALLAALGVERPLLVGHSDGGTISLLHAARHPVAGLVVIAPHVYVDCSPAAMDAVTGIRARYDEGLRDGLAQHHDDPDGMFFSWYDLWSSEGFADWNVEAECEAITAPALLVQGVDDPYGSVDQIDRIARRVSGPVERLEVPGGHAPHHEHPDVVVAAIAALSARAAPRG